MPRIELILDSNPANGAQNVSADGSQFEVVMDDMLDLTEFKNLDVSVPASSIWWVIPNITLGVNNQVYVNYLATDYVLVIPQGLYDLNGCDEAISRALAAAGLPVAPPLFQLQADSNTQRVLIKFNFAGVSLDFTQPDTPRLIWGFDPNVVGPSTLGETVTADSQAAFNQINYFLIHSDIADQGIRFNGSFNQSIGVAQIVVAPGSLNVYEPVHPATFSQNPFKRKRMKFWLTDDQNRNVNTNGEFYSFRLLFNST